MRKSPLFRGAQALAIVLSLALLAACGGHDAIKKGTSDFTGAKLPTFDLTVMADKDGQFEYDGATLAREDLAGHIRYLAEIGKPVRILLLTPGEKQKITDAHLLALAGIARDLNIVAFVRDDAGQLKVIKIVK